MATIGLDRLYYAKITENDAGEETYGTPSQLAKAISADLSVELAEATLYADDGASEIVKEFKSGTLSLGIDDIGSAAASDLTGATIDKNKVLISASEDGGDPVAVGFRAKKSNGKYMSRRRPLPCESRRKAEAGADRVPDAASAHRRGDRGHPRRAAGSDQMGERDHRLRS